MRDVYVPDRDHFERELSSLMAVQDRLAGVVADLREVVTAARAATEAVERIVTNLWVRVGVVAAVLALPVAVFVAFFHKP